MLADVSGPWASWPLLLVSVSHLIFIHSSWSCRSIRLWDTKRAACIGEGVAHHGTVKCVAAMPGHPDILASGGRDGVVALWDTRLPGSPCPGLQGPGVNSL